MKLAIPPICTAATLSLLLFFWAIAEKKKATERAEYEIHQTAETLFGAMRGSIQANLRRGKGHKDRIGQILSNIVNTTELNHFEIRQDGLMVTSSGTVPTPDIATPAGEILSAPNYWLWKTVHLQDHSPHAGQNAFGQMRQDLETNIDFTEKEQLILLGLDAAAYNDALKQSFKHIYTLMGLGFVAILIFSAAWIFILRNRELGRQLERESIRAEHLSDLQLAGAGLAHETKNPLGLIRGLAQQMTSAPETPESTRHMATDIMEQADIATARLGEFIAFSRKNKPIVESVNLHQAVKRICDLMHYDAERMGITLENNTGNQMVNADSGMLSQIIVNLLSNALNACSNGDRISFNCSDAKKGLLELRIEDSGSGIPAALQREVFKPYITGRTDGHGLGLAIVRRIVEDHAWDIELSSIEQEGTSVTISGIQCTHGEHA